MRCGLARAALCSDARAVARILVFVRLTIQFDGSQISQARRGWSRQPSHATRAALMQVNLPASQPDAGQHREPDGQGAQQKRGRVGQLPKQRGEAMHSLSDAIGARWPHCLGPSTPAGAADVATTKIATPATSGVFNRCRSHGMPALAMPGPALARQFVHRRGDVGMSRLGGLCDGGVRLPARHQ